LARVRVEPPFAGLAVALRLTTFALALATFALALAFLTTLRFEVALRGVAEAGDCATVAGAGAAWAPGTPATHSGVGKT
jgi:hypothetical protein